MTLYLPNTIWKRQLHTLLTCAVAVAGIGFMLELLITVSNTLSNKTISVDVYSSIIQMVGGFVLLTQIFVSGLLLGAEEEENQTDSFILRLPVSKERWVLERLLAVLLGLIVCFVLLIVEDLVFGLYLRIPAVASELIEALSKLFKWSLIIAVFVYFWISAFSGAVIKKVLPAAGASLAMVLLIKLLEVNIAKHSMAWVIHHAPKYFIILGIVSMGLYAFAISRREGT